MESVPLAKADSAVCKKYDDTMGPVAGSDSAVSTSAQQAEKKATSLHITFNLITCGLGTGVFTLPWSTAGASILPALLIVALVLALNAWTISILIEAGERHQTFDLGSLLSKLPGRLGQVAQYACNLVLGFTLFLCLVGYIIVMVDCVQSSVLPPHIEGNKQNPHRSEYVMLAAVCVLPLCFLDQRRLAFTSLLAVAANANIFFLLLADFAMEEMEGSRPSVCYFGMGPGSVAMVSAMMQVVVIQMCVLPMYGELENRSPAKFNRIVAVAFAVLLLLCSGFAVAGYATYGQSVSSNVLLNLPSSHWGHASRLGAATAVAAVFPIIMFALVSPFSNSQALGNLQIGDAKTASSVAMCAIIAGVMVTSVFVSDLGFLNVVNGAISLGAFVALAPSLIGLYLLGPRSNNCYWRAAMYMLIAGGMSMSFVGLAFSDNFASALHSACMWPRFSSKG
jgi:amino acid permease